jgi:hypothetical protein
MSSRIPPSLARLLILAAVSTTTPTPFHPHSSPYAFAAAAETASSTPTDVIVKTKSNNLLDAIGNKFESAAIATHNAIFQQAKEEESASLSSSSDDDVVGGLDSLEVSGVLPTHDPTTFWNNYEPTEGGNAMEAEEFIASPTQLPSSFPTLLLVKKSLTPTKHTDMHSPTLIITASTTFPTKKEDSTSPSHGTTSFAPSQAPSQHITKSPTVLDETLTETVTSCPDLFDEAAFYIEDDIISTKGSLFCRSRDCRIIYKCSVPAFCNVVVPGKEHSEEGWLKLGYCGHVTFSSDGHTSMEDEEQDVADDELPSSFPTPLHVIDDAITTTQHHQGTEDFLGEEEAVPTSRHPVLPTPHKNDQDTAVHVDIPKIICDINLPSSLAENMEQSHVLLDVVTKTIYGIFESHLSNELYGLTGISLTVSTEKDLDNSSSSTIRLHAFFSGTASFSLVTPTQSDLIELLLLHFDVEYFNNRLNFPLRLHTMDKQPVVKVNAVFFKLEDGSLVNAGYKNAKELALTAGKEAGLSVHQTQVITVFFVVAALPYVFVAIVLIMLRYMDEEEAAYLEADEKSAKPGTEEQQENDDSGKLDESVVKPSVELEIDIPWTLPPSDMSESGHNHDHSWWSSISDSLHDYTRDIESPAKVGLGITVAGHHYRQKDTLYGGRAATIGFVSELWEDHDQLEVYEDSVIDV